MQDKSRFSIRRNSVALTRTQWVAVAAALAIAIVGLLVAVAVLPSIGILVTSVATLTAVMIIAFGRQPDDHP